MLLWIKSIIHDLVCGPRAALGEGVQREAGFLGGFFACVRVDICDSLIE